MKSIWQEAELGDIAQVVTGSTPSTKRPDFFGGEIPFVTPSELDNADPVFESSTTLTALGAEQARMLPPETVMVCCIGSLGKVGFAGTELVTNQQINSLIFDKSKVFPRYGYYYCRTLKKYLEHIAPSTTLAIVNKSRFSEIKIPLPPLAEQKRIAEVLDCADALRRKRRLALQKLDTLLQSVFLEMFGDPVKNPMGWERTTIRDLVSSVNYGTSEKAGQDGGFPILRMNNITFQGGWSFTDLKYIDLSEKDKKKYLVKKGDILFNRTNSKELVGKTAVYREDYVMAFAGYLIRVRANAENNPEYISAFLNSRYGKLILNNMCKNIIGMANINAQELQDISILKPPIELQDRFALIVAKIEKTKAKLKNNLEKTENLFQSLQQKAFKGELFDDKVN